MSAGDWLFLRAMWDGRGESREQVAMRLAAFFLAAGSAESSLATWLVEGLRGSGAFLRADTSAAGIEGLLQTDRQERGFSLLLRNGINASFHAIVGHKVRSNSVVLSFPFDQAPRDSATWRSLISAAIRAFEPDSAVVSSASRVLPAPESLPGETQGWFTYRRGGFLREHPFH